MKKLILLTSLCLASVIWLAPGGYVPPRGGSSSTVTNVDTLTVTNALYLGGDSQSSPEIRIPDGGNLYFKNVSGTTLLNLNSSGDINAIGNVYAYSGFFTGDVAANNITAYNSSYAVNFYANSSITLGNNNTTLTAANYGSLSVGSAVASGQYSFASGNACTATGAVSFAAGFYAHADHDFTFVWGDANSDFHSSTDNEFSVYAENGIRLLGGAISGNGSGITNIQSTNLTGTIALARYGFTPATNGAAIVYSQLPYQGLITNANGVNLTNISPANIISNGTFIVNGVLATNSGLTSGAFLSETGTSRKYSNNGSSITNVVAAFVSGTLTNNTTGNAATATTLATSPILTNVLIWGSSARSNNFEFSTAGLTMTNLVGITNQIFNSSTGMVFTASGTNGSGSFRLNTNGAIYTTGITNTGSFTNSGAVMFGSTLTVGATTMVGSLFQSSGNVIPAAGVILNYFNQDATLTRYAAGTVLITTNARAPGIITSVNGFGVESTNTYALAATGWTNVIGANARVFVSASTTANLYNTNGVLLTPIGLISSPTMMYEMHPLERLVGTGISGTATP